MSMIDVCEKIDFIYIVGSKQRYNMNPPGAPRKSKPVITRIRPTGTVVKQLQF